MSTKKGGENMKLRKMLSMVLACMLIAGSSTPSVAKKAVS